MASANSTVFVPSNGETVSHEKDVAALIAEVPSRQTKIELTDRYRSWRCLESLLHFNEDAEVVDRGRSRTTQVAEHEARAGSAAWSKHLNRSFKNSFC
jgi:hypothetical protein